jgi:thiol-disulfide isomerase/thioredoxin
MKHLILAFFLSLSFQIVAQINTTNIKDNWFDKDGNWAMSITNDFVVYKNRHWNFKIEKQTSNKIIFVIKNGLQTKKMIVSAIDSANIFVSIDREIKDKLLSKRRFIKVPVQNNAVRTSPELVTINGFVKNYNKNSEFNTIQLGTADWISGNYCLKFSQIDSTGYFSISFLQYYPVDFSISYRHNSIQLYMVPNDTLTMCIDADNLSKNILLMGKHADIAYHVAAYSEYSGDRVFRQSGIEQEQSHNLDAKPYKIWRDSLRANDSKYISEYINAHSTSSFFNKWLSDKIKYKYLTDLENNYSFVYSFRNAQKEPFNKEYLSLVDSIDTNDSTGLANSGLFGLMNMSNILFYTYSTSRPDTRQITKSFTSKIIYRDPKERKDPNQPMKSSTVKNSEKPLNIVTNPRPQGRLMSKSTISVDECISDLQTIKNDLIKDALVASYYSKYKEYYNTDTLSNKLLSNIKSDMVKSRFYEEYNMEMNVKSNANVNSDDDGRTLLNQIISKHKNKVLYIDFWGAHCGACLDEFTFTQLKDYYNSKNKNVAFIYLCTSGDDKKWQEVIKKYHVTGDNYLLNNGQYVSLTKLINLTYVPRYIIIDRKGKIVELDAPRPKLHMNLELRQLIDKYMEE